VIAVSTEFPKVKWEIHYTKNEYHKFLHIVNAETPIEAVTDLLDVHPELKDLCKFSMKVINRMILLSPQDNAKTREKLQSVVGKSKAYDPNAHLQSHYWVMVSLFVDLFLDETLRVKRIELLRGLIDEALSSDNEPAFIKYTNELKELVE
jgi:hypothetical protein